MAVPNKVTFQNYIPMVTFPIKQSIINELFINRMAALLQEDMKIM